MNLRRNFKNYSAKYSTINLKTVNLKLTVFTKIVSQVLKGKNCKFMYCFVLFYSNRFFGSSFEILVKIWPKSGRSLNSKAQHSRII